jgi:hypothetical protein
VTVAAIRAGEVNLPLFIHVLGAMALVGFLLVVGTALAASLRDRDGDGALVLRRFGFRWMFLGVLPSYVVMRVGAQWTEAKYDFPENATPAWIDVGYVVADGTALLTLVSLVLAGIGLRNPRRGLGTAIVVITAIAIVADLVAVWAMTAKPS